MRKKINYNSIARHLILSLMFSFVVFLILSITAFLIGIFFYFSLKSGLLNTSTFKGPFPLISIYLFTSIVLGTIVSFLFGYFPLKPVNKVIDAINKLATGDFSTRLNIKHPSPFLNLSISFNTMAEELSNIELLRSDFINNFSHEFKTPIVSIKGFVEILKCNDLSNEERQEYLDIILMESDRLSSLATNVLNLSNIERQTIIPKKTHFNLGEQIRKCIVIFQSQWESKDITINAEVDDITIYANEEMLKQIWINLLNNAIKFSPHDSEIYIFMTLKSQIIEVSIHNSGIPIPPESIPYIFEKFYQVDATHTTPGNGLGLAIVKKIVELHNGSISCSSDDLETVFCVNIPLSSESSNFFNKLKTE